MILHNMRIGIITHNYPVSKDDRQNAGIFVYDIARSLKKMGHQVFILSLDQGQKVKKMEVPVTWVSWLGKGRKLGSLKISNPRDLLLFSSMLYSGSVAVEKFAQKNKIDFMVCMWAVPAGLFALWANLRKGIPYCLWALGSDVYIYARYPVLGRIIKLALGRANFLLADGIELSQQTAQIAKRRCEFLPSASNMPKQKKQIVKRGGVMKFVFLGRMEPVKGPDVLIEAVSTIADLDFELHCLGDGSLLPEVKEAVKRVGLDKKVIFYGNVNDPYQIHARLSVSDFLIIPSRSDSIPLVFSEGMKACLPVIAAEVGDLGQLIQKYQVGFTFPKEDSKKLAQILKIVIKEGRQPLNNYQEKTKKLAKLFDINYSAKQLSFLIKQSLELKNLTNSSKVRGK